MMTDSRCNRRGRFGNELHRCCTEESFMSSEGRNLTQLVAFCETRLTISEMCGLIRNMQSGTSITAMLHHAAQAPCRACGCC